MTTATQVQIRRSPWATLSTKTPADGEIGYDQTNKRLVVGDGTTLGGTAQATEAFVLTQIALLSSGTSQNLVFWENCT